MVTVADHMLTAKELREPQIKAAVIDELFASGSIDADTVIISEMPVPSLPRRADLVVANGSLIGFEIKSDADKTLRLRGQIEAYRKAFEGTIVVTGAKHLDEVLDAALDTVGVFVIDEMENDAPKARMLRKPHIRKLDMEASIRQMNARDLYRLARDHDVAGTDEKDRFTLEQRVRCLPLASVRKSALDAIKLRYLKQFQDFKHARAARVPTIEALRLLRRPAWNEPNQPASLSPTVEADEMEPSDFSDFRLSVTKRRIT